MDNELAIPLTIVFGLCVQTGAAAYFAATVRQILRDHERRIDKMEGAE